MLFNSYAFLFLFLPITAVGFAIAGGRSAKAAIAWLTLCSLGFYAWWHPPDIGLLGGSILVNYLVGRALIRMPVAARGRRALLLAGIVFNLGLLGYFKYGWFAAETASVLTGANWRIAPLVLPLAISFFTFLQIAYLVDVSRGSARQYSLIEYTFFVTFFPHLIAGPIVHHGELLGPLADRRRMQFTAEGVAVGTTLFVLGLFKKVVLADNVSAFANPVFDQAQAGAGIGMGDAWLGALAYTFQLYFDFSGYSDMAIGLGRAFGAPLPVNFNSPYKAASVVDFWRRWHITLSRFLRDYLYIPLGGSRRGPLRRLVNLFLTMLIGGLWHGAGWTFILWGGLHGLYLCVNHAWTAFADGRGWRRDGAMARTLCQGTTFLAVVAGWVLFRSESLASAGAMFQSLIGFGPHAVALVLPDQTDAVIWVALTAAVAFLCPNTQQLLATFEPASDWARTARDLAPVPRVWTWLTWRPTAAAGVMLSVLFVITVTAMTKVQEFLYFQF